MRDFISRWGCSLKQAVKMPRNRFAMKHGDRFLRMGNAMFCKVLTKETPDVEHNIRKYSNTRWRPDLPIYKELSESLNKGFAYDQASVLL